MKYILLIYVDEAKGAQMAKEVGPTQMSAPYLAYTEALKKAGAYLGGDRLQPTNVATSVKTANGKTQVLNGPYAETREQLGGYYMIEAEDLDAALAWAARCPAASYGTVEVRPIWAMQAS
ncbi:MAG TPA: YciI family protein [Candidatus Cybelea sp.]|nr:YciI family protein [Candidatus Cybelea sp.]